MRTLHFIKDQKKRKRISRETLEIYAPLAGRIGMQELKEELEDLSFTFFEPKIRDILMDHPGDNTVGIQYTTSNGSTVWLKAGPRYLVNDCENLRAELANWMR